MAASFIFFQEQDSGFQPVRHIQNSTTADMRRVHFIGFFS